MAQTSGYYRLKNSSTGTYLNFSQAANGQAAALSEYSDSNAFKFHLTGSADSGYQLRSALDESFVLNPYSDKPGDGTKITLYKQSNDGTQNWYFKKNGSGFTIHNGYSQKCVLTAGSTVTIASNASSDAQTWILEAVSAEQKKVVIHDVDTHIAEFYWGLNNWGFSNQSKNFPKGYYMDSKLLLKLLKENNPTNGDKSTLEKYAKGKWCGSCYGFTMSELLALQSYIDLNAYGLTLPITANDRKGYYSPVTGKYYGCKLLIADPNFLANGELTDEACLYFDFNDGSWIIPYWNGKQCTVNKKKCTRYCYWNANSKQQYARLTNFYTYDQKDLNDTLEVNHYLAGIELNDTSSTDYLLSSVADSGDTMYNSGDGTDIAPVSRFAELMDGEELSEEELQECEYALWNPTSNYSLVYDTPQSYDLKRICRN